MLYAPYITFFSLQSNICRSTSACPYHFGNHLPFSGGSCRSADPFRTYCYVLKEYAGTLIHDHETAAYHSGTRHGECNVHLQRYLLKNTEEAGNTWSHDMSMFLNGMNHARNEHLRKGRHSFMEGQLEKYERRYDAIIAVGREQNRKTKGRIAKKEEKTLLNRLVKFLMYVCFPFVVTTVASVHTSPELSIAFSIAGRISPQASANLRQKL